MKSQHYDETECPTCQSSSCPSNKVRHTPTPWKVDKSNSQRILKGKKVICHLIDDMDSLNCLKNEADIHFIVKAVNSHKALLEAAKLALNALDGLPFKKNFDARNFLQAAISQAEGK